MALPNPLPDNPLKWDGWRFYNSQDYYARLCLEFSSNATDEVIEENCRQLLVWWQKKLPLKNQPSNPMAQILRQGLDEAPQYLVEARTKLLDPNARVMIDIDQQQRAVEGALVEFRKLLSFTIADMELTKEGEARLLNAGRRLGLSDGDMNSVIEAELEKSGAVRVSALAPVALAVPAPVGKDRTSEQWSANASPVEGRDPFEEFRRILKMSRLCMDGEDMTDDQRDAMCNLGEGLGLTGGDAEDLIDEYLAEVEIAHIAPSVPPRDGVKRAPVPQRPVPIRPVAPLKSAAPSPSAEPERQLGRGIATTPAARAAQRQRYPNFINSAGGEMYLIPSGEFVMGFDGPSAQSNEQPLTPVTLSCFFMARFPVTNSQYERFDPAHKNKRAPWADENHPAVYVTWLEAVAFCNWLSQREGKRYRLPTEAEWEYAARGDEGRIFPWGNEFSSGNLANFADSRTSFTWRDPHVDDGFAETAPIGSFPRGASSFGVEDLAGNVFEWCNDCIGPYRGKPTSNPVGIPSGKNRVYRGGSWRSRIPSLRATARNSNSAKYMGNDVGFRVICECD